MAFFLVLGRLPRAPNFAEIHARGGGGRLPVMPRDLIPPWGAHFSTAKRESRPRQSGLPSQRVCLGGGRSGGVGGGRDLSGASGGAWRAGFGGVAGEKRRAGGAGGVSAGKGGGFGRKISHTWAAAGVPGLRGRLVPGARRAETGRVPGAQRGDRAEQRAGGG